MRLLLLVGAALLALSFPAFAQSCDYTFDDVANNQLRANGYPVVIVPDADLPALLAEVESLTGESYGDVTRAFLANVDGTVLLGLEVGGCLLPPIVVGVAAAPASDTLSGRVGTETYA